MKSLKTPMLLLLMVIPKIEGHIEINATLSAVGVAQQRTVRVLDTKKPGDLAVTGLFAAWA